MTRSVSSLQLGRQLRIRCVRLAPSRAYSTGPPPPSETPTLQDGFSGWAAFIRRCQARSPQLALYREKDLFAPFPLALSDHLLFAKLQQPTHTQVDLDEFLQGASQAYEFVVRTMFSPELRRFAMGEGEKMEAIQRLERAVWPNCYHPHLHNVRSMKNDLTNKMELKDVTIKSVQLIDVVWKRVPLSTVLAEEQFARDATNEYIKQKFNADAATFKAGAAFDEDRAAELEERVFNASKEDDSVGEDSDIMVEQLRLDVYIESVEHLVGKADDGDDDEEALELIVREIDSVVQFGSLVTSEADLDWRIVRFKESASEVVEREALE